MIRADQLEKSYGGEQIFSNLSFQLNPGDRWGLVGRNGSGKSTLLKILVGKESQDHGTIHIPKNYQIGYLEQHIKFTRPTVLEEASIALLPEDKDKTYKVEAILSGLGFKETDFQKNPNSFSGGYQLRIQLAKTLINEPNCLLLDEPTNYLDIVSIRWLTRFLSNRKGELILISHDRSFLDSIATHTVGLHRKQLYKVKGKTANFYDFIMQMEEVHEKSREKIEKKKEGAEAFIRRFGAKATKAKQAQSRLKMIHKLPSLEKLAAIEGLDYNFRYAPFPGLKMFDIKNISFAYPEMNSLLINNFSLEIERGDRIAVVGKNGRGKSTFLKLLTGELECTEGSMKLSENTKIGYFGQTNVNRLNLQSTVEEEIRSSNRNLSISEVKGICGLMMFSQSLSEKKIGVLSGGERSRVVLGKIVASPCNCLLLDEPSNHLDIESVEALCEALDEFEGAVIIVTHNEEILYRIPEKFITFKEGKQSVFLGNYEEYLEKIGWETPEKEPAKSGGISEKEEKRRRAEQVQERSKLLTPLKTAEKKIELSIQNQEESLHNLQQELCLSAEKNESGRIVEISKKISEIEKKLESLYSELDDIDRQITCIEK